MTAQLPLTLWGGREGVSPEMHCYWHTQNHNKSILWCIISGLLSLSDLHKGTGYRDLLLDCVMETSPMSVVDTRALVAGTVQFGLWMVCLFLVAGSCHTLYTRKESSRGCRSWCCVLAGLLTLPDTLDGWGVKSQWDWFQRDCDSGYN